MPTGTSTLATGAPVERPAPVASRSYDDWAHEVGQLLTAALARDDERHRHRCPRCGQLRFHEDLS